MRIHADPDPQPWREQIPKPISNRSVAEPEPAEPKLFWDLEPEPKINFNEHFLQSVLRMLG